jgi:hypothetical protein
MPAKPRTKDDVLFDLLDAISAAGEDPTIALLRERAGGGSYARLKAVIERWTAARTGAGQARPSVPDAPRAAPVRDPGAPEPVPAQEAAGLAVENARLQARLEEMQRENDRLWDHLNEERNARMREIERLNSLIDSLHKQAVADRRAIREDYSAVIGTIRRSS